MRGALPDSVLQPIRDLIDRNVDAHARELHGEGAIESIHADASFERRLALLYRDSESRMRSWNTFLFSPELYALIRHETILDALQPLLGEEISFNGDYHLRPKLPGRTNTAFPLHQDSQYYGPTTGHILVISVWNPAGRRGRAQRLPAPHPRQPQVGACCPARAAPTATW